MTKINQAALVDGYARIIREFDRNRNIIDERYFDGQGKPFLAKGAYAQHKSRYDDHNNLVEEAYLGPVESPLPVRRERRTTLGAMTSITPWWKKPGSEPARTRPQ